MSLNLASLNARGMRDRSHASRVLRDLLSLNVDVAAIEETHFVCEADERVLSGDYVVFSAYGDRLARGVSLLVKRSLDAVVDIVHVGADGRLIVADVAVKSGSFRVVAVYAPNSAVERRSFLRRLGPFLTSPKRLVLMGDWNAILDPKIDKGERGASENVNCESSLIDFIAEHDLVDRFRVDHPGGRCGHLVGLLIFVEPT